MPTVQSTADANVSLRPTAEGAQSRDEVAVASEPAGRNQSENSAPSSESLFREFQAWAAEKDAAGTGRVRTTARSKCRGKGCGNARASLRLTQKHRHVRPVHNARAEMRPVLNPRKKIRRGQNARVEAPSAQDARAPDQSIQNPFLQLFGWPN
jgi:hypothetical protein